MVPVYGHVTADPAAWGEPLDYVLVAPPAPTVDPLRYVALVVDGDCLAPEFRPGDIVLVDRSLPPLDHKPAVIINGDGRTHLKRLERISGQWHFASNDGDLVPFESVVYFGIVVRLIRDTL